MLICTFVLFMVMVSILLFNMLIAMMGNTYAQVIERSEKEFVKQVSPSTSTRSNLVLFSLMLFYKVS